MLVDEINAELQESRRISKDLVEFLSEGQPGVETDSKFGVTLDPFEFVNDYLPDLNDSDLLALANWKVTNRFDVGLSQYPPLSTELAKKLPIGHPLRRLHKLSDKAESRVSWMLGDQDLKATDRETFANLYFQKEIRNRVRDWPLLLAMLERKLLGTEEWRSDLRYAAMTPFEEFLESLGAKNIAVLRQFSVHEVSPPERWWSSPKLTTTGANRIGEHFRTTPDDVTAIFDETFREIASNFRSQLEEIGNWIHELKAAPIQVHAGVLQDLSVDSFPTRILVAAMPAKFIRGTLGDLIVVE